MEQFKIVFKNEMLGIWREPRFWVPFIIPPLFVIAAQVISQVSGEVNRSLFLLVGVLFATMSVSLASDSFAGERERKTLETLLSSPLSGQALFWGKSMSVFGFPFSLATLGQVSFFALSSLSVYEFVIGLMHSTLATLFICSFTLYLSMKFETVRACAQTSLLIILPLYFYVQLFAHFIIHDLIYTLATFSVYLIFTLFFSTLAKHQFKRINF